MWQLICLCLPAMTIDERQRLFALFDNSLPAVGREGDELDIGLSFLRTLSLDEALTVLEERRDLVVRSQELVADLPENAAAESLIQNAIDDHIQTLLVAERGWLERTIAQLRIHRAIDHKKYASSILTSYEI